MFDKYISQLLRLKKISNMINYIELLYILLSYKL